MSRAGTTTYYAELRKIFDFEHREARFEQPVL